MINRLLRINFVVILLSCSVLIGLASDVQAQQTKPGQEYSLKSEGEEFTIIGMPDTQVYTWRFPGVFYEQTEWIKNNVSLLNCKAVVHLGDVVEHSQSKEEWEIANKALSTLDGVVPYAIAIGNHDLPPNLYNEYFPPSRFNKEKWYGGNFWKTNEANFTFFEASGMKFMIVCLSFDPSILMLKWANKVVSEHPDHRVIVVTHSFVTSRGEYTDDGGQEIWNDFVRKHKNIFLVLCGHLSVGQRTDKGDNGNTVYSLLSDYQGLNFGGEGWLRILRFVPKKNIIEVRTYSTGMKKFFSKGDGKYSTPEMNQFNLSYDMSVAQKETGK